MKVWVLLLSSIVAAQALAEATAPTADDLLLVDCRLAPKIKRIGGRTYTVAGKPVRTTAVDCRIRGGEYTVYDRGNYATSLKIWLAEAEKGDVEAEYYVGKLYEGGLGTEPDYKTAATWYEKAAKAGHSASQFSLGTLYEKGLGVPADPAKAFTLYRTAAGLPANVVIVENDKYEALEKAANELALREQQVEELQRQLDAAKKQIKRDEKKENELLRQLDDERHRSESQKTEVARIQKLVQRPQVLSQVPTSSSPPAPVTQQPSCRRVHARTSGASTRSSSATAATSTSRPSPRAEADARAMAAVLRDQYGFQVTLLLNARRTRRSSRRSTRSARTSPRTTTSSSSTPATASATCATGAAGGCPPTPARSATRRRTGFRIRK